MGKLKSSFICLFFVWAVSGCSTINEFMGMPTNKGNGYIIKHKKQIYGGSVHIEYRDSSLLESEMLETMNNRMASEEDISRELALIPRGGRVFVTYEKMTIGAANTKWLEYVVLHNGKEIYRRKGTNKVANTPAYGSSFWWNIDSFSISEPVDGEFSVVVISNLENKRDTFLVSPPPSSNK